MIKPMTLVKFQVAKKGYSFYQDMIIYNKG